MTHRVGAAILADHAHTRSFLKGFPVKLTLRLNAIFIFLVAVTQCAIAQNAATAKVSGIDKSLFSESIAPGENFYLYANQVWLDNTPIPGDKSNYGIFTVLDDETREQVRALIEESAETEHEAGTPAQKVGDLYSSVLDVNAQPSRHRAAVAAAEKDRRRDDQG